jgi:hypothetical protein
VDDLYESLDRAGAGARLTLALVRGTETRDLEVSLDSVEA